MRNDHQPISKGFQRQYKSRETVNVKGLERSLLVERFFVFVEKKAREKGKRKG